MKRRGASLRWYSYAFAPARPEGRPSSLKCLNESAPAGLREPALSGEGGSTVLTFIKSSSIPGSE